MKFNYKKLDDIERCYSTSFVRIDGELVMLVASEAIDGPCYSYRGENFEKKEVVWEKGGGTMSIVEIPNTNGEFLATIGFFPGFNALHSKIVHGKYVNNQWVIEDIIEIPYVHRFDIIKGYNGYYLVAATLCTSKTERNDWSDPGKILVGKISENIKDPIKLEVLEEGLVKNHGYSRGVWEGKESSFITADNGAYVITPPQKENEKWFIKKLIDRPISDISLFDIDGDGVQEIATIEPFHGNLYRINKLIDGEYKVVYEYPNKTDFLHVVWGGELNHKRVFLGGSRRENAEMFMVEYENNEYKTTILDTGKGPANIAVARYKEKDYVITANNTIHEACYYLVED